MKPNTSKPLRHRITPHAPVESNLRHTYSFWLLEILSQETCSSTIQPNHPLPFPRYQRESWWQTHVCLLAKSRRIEHVNPLLELSVISLLLKGEQNSRFVSWVNASVFTPCPSVSMAFGSWPSDRWWTLSLRGVPHTPAKC